MTRLFVLAPLTLGALALLGCEICPPNCYGPDAGRSACLEWAALVAECDGSNPDDFIDIWCDDIIFEAAASAGCSWENYYESCLDTVECTVNGATYQCSGTCD